MKLISNIFFIAVLIFFISCNKNEDLISESKDNSFELSAIDGEIILGNVPFIKNPYDVEKYLEVYEDLDDERINRSLYEVSLITREILKTKDWNELIVSKAKENLSSTMKIEGLLSETNLKSSNVLFNELKNKLDNIDLKHMSNNPLKSGVVEDYVPAFYVPNIDIADFSKQSIISSGVEVNRELPDVEDLEGYIVGWTYDDNGDLQEFLFNEETAMKTTHPIFIVDNSNDVLMNTPCSENNKLSVSPSLKSVNTNQQLGVSLHEYKLNYRFESTGNSEFWVKCLHVDGYGTYYGPLHGLNSSIEQEIAVVDKDDIGEDLLKWFKIANGDYDPIESQALVWNTYERDWFRSEKSIGIATHAGGTFYLSGNMHYDGDWYGCDPANINDNNVDLAYLYSNWDIDFSSDHATSTLWRTSY